MIDALPLRVTPPSERTEQLEAVTVGVPDSDTALLVVPSARMHGCAEVAGISSAMDCAGMLYELALTNSLANDNATGFCTVTRKATSLALRMPLTCWTVTRPSVRLLVLAVQVRVLEGMPFSSATSAAALAAVWAFDVAE